MEHQRPLSLREALTAALETTKTSKLRGKM